MSSILISERLSQEYSGDFLEDSVSRKIYSTDASVYQEQPAAVAFPKNENDIRLLIKLANETNIGLIPRTAGTSLAGQVVGSGIVVDVSRYMTEIIEVNSDAGWVRVQPGVIRNELNMALRPHGLLFGPETSTANRAMIGGMLGNNSCGSNSIVYGSTRDKTLRVKGFLSDGSLVTLEPKTTEQLKTICSGNGDCRESNIYQGIHNILSDAENRAHIQREFPDPNINRRNTGYAIDLLMQTEPYGNFAEPFNLSRLIAGSEGTLFFATEIQLQCDPLPPAHRGVLCAHFNSIDEALRANILAVQASPFASELIDRLVLEGAKRNIAQRQNLKFVEGDPAAILMVEIKDTSEAATNQRLEHLVGQLKSNSLGYHHPLFLGDAGNPVWELRKAGLGVVANVPGDSKPTTVIEDVAVTIESLPSYIRELNELLRSKYDVSCVHYGHAGSGELHMRPILNLKTEEGKQAFRSIASDVARLTKKYQGSLSGEHGDGRLRGEFLEEMIGQHNYQLLRDVKNLFDPENIFNPGKIIDAPSMLDNLRVDLVAARNVKTIFNHDLTNGLLGAAEMCSGSGDCRKTELTGGTMCPSYMATRAEKDTTRARANLLRHALSDRDTLDPFASEDVKKVMDLCLSCKGCKKECPSNVDVAKMKAEFLQGYQDANGTSLRTRLITGIDRINRINSVWPAMYNFLAGGSMSSGLIKRITGFHSKRSLPRLHKTSLRKWFAKHVPHSNSGKIGSVVLFCDEFTNYNDVPIGIAAVELLEQLGYSISMPKHPESGRASMSNGLLRRARKFAIENVEVFSSVVSKNTPLIGLEPSAILSFRDEYIDLVPESHRDSAAKLASNCFLFDEFIAQEIEKGNIGSDQFSSDSKALFIHGHCHQKALASQLPSIKTMQLPRNYRVKLIPSGCCGMAGSFGYEKEHYEISMRIGELVLFPFIRKQLPETVIVAAGTSCRHQIADGTSRVALHPAQVLRAAIKGD